MKISLVCASILLSVGANANVAAQDGQQPSNPTDKTTVIVRSAGTGYTPSGPAPAFAELDQDGDSIISKAEASGYKLLANDFLKADGDESGSVSISEYERWAAQP